MTARARSSPSSELMELVARLTDPSPETRLDASGGLYWSMQKARHDDSILAVLPAVLSAKEAAAARHERLTEINLQQVIALVGPIAIPYLLQDLHSAARESRSGAAMTLGLMGSLARQALPALVEAAGNEKDALVHHYLVGAIAGIRR
ncbi:MAG: hypothetical protein ABW221_26210 [Vicinamibacteria bacterium]